MFRWLGEYQRVALVEPEMKPHGRAVPALQPVTHARRYAAPQRAAPITEIAPTPEAQYGAFEQWEMTVYYNGPPPDGPHTPWYSKVLSMPKASALAVANALCSPTEPQPTNVTKIILQNQATGETITKGWCAPYGGWPSGGVPASWGNVYYDVTQEKPVREVRQLPYAAPYGMRGVGAQRLSTPQREALVEPTTFPGRKGASRGIVYPGLPLVPGYQQYVEPQRAAPIEPTHGRLIEPPQSNVWKVVVYSQQGHPLGSMQLASATKQQASNYASQACQHFAGAAYVKLQHKGTNELLTVQCYSSLSGTDGTLGVAATKATIAKAQLLTWAKANPDANPLSSYGQVPEDLTPTWEARDRVVLSGFSKWWNSKKFSPLLPVGLPSPVGLQVPLSEAHAYALNQWAANQLPNAPPAWPGGVPVPPVPGPPSALPWPPGVAWPPVGLERPPGWPQGVPWPPPKPLGWPAPWPLPIPQIPGAPTGSLPPPPTPQEPAPKGKLPVPPKPIPGTEPAPPTGPLPPPPAPQPAAEPKKASSTVLWLLGGAALVTVAVFAFSVDKSYAQKA